MKVENERIQDITKSQNKHKRLGKSTLQYMKQSVVPLSIFIGIDF